MILLKAIFFSLILLSSVLIIPSVFAETWYVGKGLKQGDYFRYNVCHIGYRNCVPLEIGFWVQNQSTSHDYFLQMIVINESKIQKGTVMTTPELDPVYSDPNITDYSNIYKNTIFWLGRLAPPESPRDFDAPTWSHLGMARNNGIGPMGQEQVIVQAGSYNAWVLGWKGAMNDNGNDIKFWVVPTMPFPIKGTWTDVIQGASQLQFYFELLETGHSKTEPIWVKTETSSLENSKDIAVNSTNNNMQHITTSKLIPNPYERIFSPLKQFRSGIALQDVKCETDLGLIIIEKNGKPYCVKPQTAEKLVERGWGALKEQMVWFEFDHIACQQTSWAKSFNTLTGMYSDSFMIKRYFKEQGITILEAKQTPPLPSGVMIPPPVW